MIKKIVIIALCALPFGLFAQESKLGHINSQEIISLMPEIANIEKEVDAMGKQYESEIVKMQDEYNVKIKEFQQKQDSMPEGIKKAQIDLTREDIQNSPYFWLQNGDLVMFNTKPKSLYGFGKEPIQTLTTGVTILTTALSIYLLFSKL